MAKISGLGKDGDLKFGQNISNRYLLKVTKFQQHTLFRFKVI